MWVKGRKEAKHTAMCVPMQLSCMFCTCTPKPKMQLKKKERDRDHPGRHGETLSLLKIQKLDGHGGARL